MGRGRHRWETCTEWLPSSQPKCQTSIGLERDALRMCARAEGVTCCVVGWRDLRPVGYMGEVPADVAEWL